VWAWSECESCRDKKPHTHNLLARKIPIHGGFVATYHPPDVTLVEYRRSRGDNSWDHYLQPYWSPERPKYWQYIESPYASESGE